MNLDTFPAKNLGTNENIEFSSILEGVGESIISFYNEGGSFLKKDLEEILSFRFPNAEVTVVTVFRPTGAQELYFSDKRETSARTYLRIKIKDKKIGELSMLAPYPANNDRFEGVQGFKTDKGISPNNLKHAVPATLKRNAFRWEIKDEGILSKQSTNKSETSLEDAVTTIKKLDVQIAKLVAQRDSLKEKVNSKTEGYSV